MGHPIGEIKKVAKFSVNGTLFDTLEEAKAYETTLTKEQNLTKTQNLRAIALKRNSKGLGGYYGVFNGVLFRGGEADEALKSMILDTPETTLKLLLTLDEVEFEEEGPIKGELPADVGDEFVKRVSE